MKISAILNSLLLCCIACVGFAINDRPENVSLRSGRADSAAGQLPAYHATWENNRGFQVGQTLPDIPLFDMQGREVRFSNFLGKKYILYCWASW